MEEENKFVKILLLGEFSALHKNLKEGLIDIGHEAVVAASGDGFKKVPVDISFDFDSPLKGPFRKLHNRAQLLSALGGFKDFDVIQMINPFIFPQACFPNVYAIEKLIKKNRKFFLSGAGDDAFFWQHGRKNLKYGPFDDFLKYDLQKKTSPLESKKSLDFNEWLVSKSNGVIPIMYEYEKSYEICSKRLNTIPIPINLSKIKYKDNELNGKLVVFHGLNRYGFKGTRHVEKAFDYLRAKYPNDLELVIEGNLPLDEYLQLMQRTNVIIDQLYSHSLGVNGVYALAMGKIVMGGAEPESLVSLGIESSPVINLKPNVQSIIDEIEKLLQNRDNVKAIGFESREFAEKVHGHRKVAQQYVETWSAN